MLRLSFDPFPELQTERLILRRITVDDTDALYAMRSDPAVMQHIARPLAQNPADVRNLIGVLEENLNNNSGITWGITLKGDTTLIGTFGFWRIEPEHYRAEIGYLLHRGFWNRGITHEAMQPVMQYGFEQIGLHTVEARISPDNMASVRLVERNGYVREAHLKENYYWKGRFSDTLIYTCFNPKHPAGYTPE